MLLWAEIGWNSFICFLKLGVLELGVPATTQKMKFFITDFFSKCDQIRSFTSTEQIRTGKLHFSCSVLFSCCKIFWIMFLVINFCTIMSLLNFWCIRHNFNSNKEIHLMSLFSRKKVKTATFTWLINLKHSNFRSYFFPCILRNILKNIWKCIITKRAMRARIMPVNVFTMQTSKIAHGPIYWR